MNRLPGLDERFLQDKLEEIAGDLKSLPQKASVAALDAVIESHLKF